MKFDNKTFQQKYEAWKNGADYWKDIRGINLGGDTQAEEPSPEEQQQIDQRVQSILNAYNSGKDVFTSDIAEDIKKPMPYDAPLNNEYPILSKYKGGKDDYINTFVSRIAPLVGQQLNRYGYKNDATFYNIMRQLAWESNYGRSRVARQQHNYGGVGWNGKTYTTYKNDADFVQNYIRLMHNRYGAALRAKTTQDYARALKQKGYYEDSLQNYTNGLIGMKSVVKASAAHRLNNKDKYNYNVKLDDVIQDYEDAKNASPIIINSPSTKQPATINAVIPTTLIGPTEEQIKAEQYNKIRQQVFDQLTSPIPMPPAIQKMLQGNDKGKDSFGQKFWLRRGNNLHFKVGKDNLPKFTDGDDGNTFGGNIAKALGAGEIGQEIANFGTQMIPVVGTYYDWKTAVNDPSIENIGTALMTTAGDIFTLGAGGMAIRAGLKAAKAAAKYKKAMAAYNTAKTLVPGTKQVTRAIRVAGNAADEARIAAQRHKAIKNIKNSTKATVATHLTDAKDLYERVKKHYNK